MASPSRGCRARARARVNYVSTPLSLCAALFSAPRHHILCSREDSGRAGRATRSHLYTRHSCPYSSSEAGRAVFCPRGCFADLGTL